MTTPLSKIAALFVLNCWYQNEAFRERDAYARPEEVWWRCVAGAWRLESPTEDETCFPQATAVDLGVPRVNDLFVPASQIHDHYTRHAMSGFYPYRYNQNYGLRSFAHTGCRLWNSLSEDVQTSDSLKSFKQRLHKVYFPTNGGE